MKRLAAIVSALLLSLPGLAAAASLLESARLEPRIGARLPLAAVVTDAQCHTRELGTLLGSRPTVLLLAYYTCRSLCQTMIGELANRVSELDLRVPSDFQVLVLSFDATDTPLRARALKSHYLPRARSWRFLTAAPDVLEQITSAIGFRYGKDRSAFVHPSTAVILTPTGRVSSYFVPVEPDVTALRYGLIAASGDRLGTPLDRLWLLCHRYDPDSGRYTSLVLDIVRATGALSALGLALGIAWNVRRPRR